MEEVYNKIKTMYLNKCSIKSICRKIGRSQSFVEGYLKREKLYVDKSGNTFDADLSRFNLELGYCFKAVCKKNGTIFNDYKNCSGELTIYLKKEYPDLEFPKNSFKRDYLKKTGKYWHEQFFDLIKVKVEEKETKKCKYCDWATVDLNNNSGWYTTHLKKEHNISIEEYVEEYPDERKLFPTYLSKYEHRKFVESDPKNHIECKLCGEKLTKITSSHVIHKHGITLEEYRITASENTLSETSLQKFKTTYDKGLRLYEPKFTSSGHNEINEFLTELGFTFIVNDKKLLSGIELDIYIPDKKMAIEYNGLYYHSEISGKKDRQFHLSKTKECEKQGIQLIHIFEDDWKLKKEIIKSKLRHILGVNKSEIVYARKCTISEITNPQRDKFLEENHIQGSTNSTVSIGAFYGDRLISVMTFDNKRVMTASHIDDKTYELTRFAIDINLRSPGVAGKLLSYFIENFKPKKVISFADKCWTPSNKVNLYINLGFKQDSVIPPDYKYFNSNISVKRLHKFAFGKSSLKKRFPEIYSDDKSEWQIVREAGYDRVWDCGKIKFILEL